MFVDVEIGTHNIDASQLEAAITPRTKAIMLAHTLGNPFNLEVVQRVCQQHGLWLVEDCCDTLGATYQGRKVGNLWRPGHPPVLPGPPRHGRRWRRADQQRRAGIAESFRDWGRDCWCPPGRTTPAASVFCWKLGRLPEGYDHKYTYGHLGCKPQDHRHAGRLRAGADGPPGGLHRHPQGQLPVPAPAPAVLRRSSWCHPRPRPAATRPGSVSHYLGEEAGVRRVDLLQYLGPAQGGHARLLFAGNLTPAPMQGRTYRTVGELPHTDRVMNDTFWLGVYPGPHHKTTSSTPPARSRPSWASGF